MLLSRAVISGAVFALLGVYFAGADTWLAFLGAFAESGLDPWY
jgi:uncharacterized membrane protein